MGGGNIYSSPATEYRDKLVVTDGSKYGYTITQPKNGTIYCYLECSLKYNGDKTWTPITYPHLTYTPSTGYVSGTINYNFDVSSNKFLISGTDAIATSLINNKGFLKCYIRGDIFHAYVYSDSEYNNELGEIDEVSGKLCIEGLKTDRREVSFETENVTVIFGPSIMTNSDATLSFCAYSSNYNDTLKYVSFPSWTGQINTANTFTGYDHKGFKYLDIGHSIGLKYNTDRNFYITDLVIRNTDTIVPSETFGPKNITTAFVPSKLIKLYKADSKWAKYTTNFIALEGSKYEDPTAFMDLI